MPSVKVFSTNDGEVSLSGKYLCLHQVKVGTAVAINADHRHPLVGDGFLLQNVGTPHRVKADSTEVVTICIPEVLLPNQRFEECLTPRDFFLDKAVSNLINSSGRSAKIDSKQLVDEVLYSLLAARDTSSQNFYLREVSGANRSRSLSMRSAREFILSNLAKPLSVPQVAEHMSFSAFHFHRQFTEWHGMTPGRYILQEKIRRACRRLVLRDDPVSIISLDCGFYSPTSFAGSFRSITGCAPSSFRAMHRKHRQELDFYEGIS
jgi:AraC-like DNA-binding protein